MKKNRKVLPCVICGAELTTGAKLDDHMMLSHSYIRRGGKVVNPKEFDFVSRRPVALKKERRVTVGQKANFVRLVNGQIGLCAFCGFSGHPRELGRHIAKEHADKMAKEKTCWCGRVALCHVAGRFFCKLHRGDAAVASQNKF